MRLSIQIVNFKSRQSLRDCLFSLRENLPRNLRAEVILTNNDAERLEGTRDIPGGDLPIQIVEINKNVGFGKAHNFGAGKSRGEFILFLNPDTKVPGGAVEKMLSVFEMDEEIGIVGPLLVDGENDIQPDCFGSRKTPLSIIGKKIFSEIAPGDLPPRGIFETDWVSGGAMMIRKDVFEQTGGFDENYFMYFEDADLCLRVKKAGYKVAVNPAVRIFHEGGQSFESEREKKKHYYASQDHYMRKHFGSISMWLVKIMRLPYYIKNIYFGR